MTHTPCLRASLLVAVALATSAGSPEAQVTPLDYAHNWAPMASSVSVAWSGPALFSLGSPILNYAGRGDAIRRCYGIDSGQIGKNDGTVAAPMFRKSIGNFRISQAFAAANTIPGVDIGLVSVQIGSESDPNGDACFAPFLPSAGNTGGHQVIVSAVIGVIQGTQGAPFPNVFDIPFQWVGTSMVSQPGYKGLSVPTTLGTGPGQSAGVTNPLLTTLIYEVQGPENGGPDNNQYYLGSTTEVTGTGNGTPGAGPASYGTGGVTNGNLGYGSNLTGVDAATSGFISHSRIIANPPFFGGVAIGVPSMPGIPAGRVEVSGFLGFKSPFLWAINDGNDGAGGPDWRASTAPVSIVDLRMQYQLAGAMATSAVFGTGGPSAAFESGIVFNAPVFLWSATPSATMVQSPMSWDDLGGAVPAQPGGLILGTVGTRFEGPEPIPINFDAISVAFLNFVGLTFGTTFTDSDDIFLDGVPPPPQTSSYMQGNFSSLTSGVSNLSNGASPVASGPTPNLAGRKLGVVGIAVQVNPSAGKSGVIDLSSPLTLNLQ